jgi:hypothetical protein
MDTASRNARPGRALWIPVAFAAALAGFVAAHVSGVVPFTSDEANHANLALRQFQDLRDGRIADFVRHSYRTGQFPFLHGWTLLPWFAAFGATPFAARAAQCLAFVVGAIATGWAAFRASDDDRRAAAIGAGLFVLSPLLGTYAGMCMLEVPGAAATATTLAVFAEACRATGRRAHLWHLATAAAALATYFTKLNYGLWILPAVGAGYAVRWLRSTSRRDALRDALVYVGAVVVVLGAWYSTAGQRAAFMGFLHNPSQAVSVESDDPTFRVPGLRADNFTAYLTILARDYNAHWLVGAVVLAAFVFGARATMRRPEIAASVACFAWTTLVLSMGFREYPLARFIAPALPAIWIVAAVGAAELLRRAGDRPWLPAAGAAALALGLGMQFARQPELLATAYKTDGRFAPVFDFVCDAIPPRASVLVVGYTDKTSARTVQWDLGARRGSAWRDYDVVGFNSERVYESAKRFDDWMSKARPWGAPDWTSYVVEISTGPRYLDAGVVVPKTAAMWRDAVRRSEGRLVRAAERRFDDLDVTATVWRDTSPPPHLGQHGGE